VVHSNGVDHKEKQNELARDMRSIELILVRYVRLCSQCGTVSAGNEITNRAWRSLVQSSLFRYLMTPVPNFYIEDPMEEQLLAEALNATKSYLYWENATILGCAVWKAQCLLQMPEINGFFAQQQWHTYGWKMYKTQHRESEAISVVVALVRPFLDPLKVSSRSDAVTASNTPMRLSSRREALSVLLKSNSSDSTVSQSMHFRFGDETYGFSGSRQCALCNVHAPAWHYFDAEHQEREVHLREDLQKIVTVMKRLVGILTSPFHSELNLLGQITHAPWRNSVQAGLFRYVFCPATDVHADDELLRQTLLNLRRHHFSDRLALVGLAAWKAQCLCQVPDSGHYLTYAQWIASGWKTCKASQRDSNAMNVIVTCVKPFLDPPQTSLDVDGMAGW
jgi:hypothetical protein